MTKKEIAKEFLKLTSKSDARETFERYVSVRFKHNNPYFKGDRDSLMTAMEESASKNPNKIFKHLELLKRMKLLEPLPTKTQ